jgi:HlyD family secretion protein
MRRLSLARAGILVGVLAVASAGGYAGYQRVAPPPVAAARIQSADVARGTISNSVTATGSVAIPAQAKLGFKNGGRLVELRVGVGDQVEAGQALARVDEGELRLALLQAQANFGTAQVKLEQTQAGALPEDLLAAEGQLESARMKLQQARVAVSGPDLAVSESQVENARNKLDQVLAGARPEDLAAAQSQLEVAQAKLQALLEPRPEDLAAAQSQVETARLKLAQLQNPRPEDIRNAETALALAQAKLDALHQPRPEDVAAAQLALDQQKTKMAQLLDQPPARPEDIANAELSVRTAELNLDKARAEAVKPATGTSTVSAETAVRQAEISLDVARNNLSKLRGTRPTDWEIRQQQLSLDQAQANLDKLRSPSPIDVQNAQAAVDQAHQALGKLRNPSPIDLQLAQEAVKQAEVSLDKLRNPGPVELLSAQQAVVQAQASLDKLRHPADADIQTAQQAVVQAQANLDKFRTSTGFDLASAEQAFAQARGNLELKKAGATPQDIAAATVAVQVAQAQLQQAEANLAGATLVAPFPGVVSAVVGNVGEQATVDTVTLVDTRQLRVDVVVDETDVGKVRVGQQVSLTLEALSGQRVSGRVSVVAPVGTVTQGVVNFQVRIAVDPAQAREMRPGMTATAQIVTASKSDVLVVPNRALRTQGRERIIEVLQPDGSTVTRPVQVGLANDQQSEIVSGVQLGERVVLPSTTAAAPRVGGGGLGTVQVRR